MRIKHPEREWSRFHLGTQAGWKNATGKVVGWGVFPWWKCARGGPRKTSWGGAKFSRTISLCRGGQTVFSGSGSFWPPARMPDATGSGATGAHFFPGEPLVRKAVKASDHRQFFNPTRAVPRANLYLLTYAHYPYCFLYCPPKSTPLTLFHGRKRSTVPNNIHQRT